MLQAVDIKSSGITCVADDIKRKTWGTVYVNKLIDRAAIASGWQHICIVQVSGCTSVVRAAP